MQMPEADATGLDQLSLATAEAALRALGSGPDGLDAAEAARRLAATGPNQVAQDAEPSLPAELWGRARNPLNGLLLSLAAVSMLLGDLRAAAVIATMVVLAVLTAFIQEHRSNHAAARLRAMVTTTASVRRRGADGVAALAEVPIAALVPGDVVQLSAGDMIPGDLRLLEAKDLFVNQSALTGESMAAEKFAEPAVQPAPSPFELSNICFMGSNVVSGYGAGVLARTGRHTSFGALAHQVAGQRPASAFDRGVDRFTWLMIRFMAVMVPLVFLINGLTKHDWIEALFFAVAVAVGLTPEMLPMIVTVNLAKGALAMAKERVIVKRLHAIQDVGAMDVLCTDKTGTLTQDRIILKRHLDIRGHESEQVLQYAYLNSHFQSGLKNLLDVAVLEHVDLHGKLGIDRGYAKVDEIPFDFGRRRLSVIVAQPDGKHVLICKGAVEEMSAACTEYVIGAEHGMLDPSHFAAARTETEALNADGFRVVAVGYKEMPPERTVYSAADEAGLTLLGYIAFLDPPKESARRAIAALAARGVAVKVLTGDNPIVARKVCHDVGLATGAVLNGADVDAMDDQALAEAATRAKLIAKLSPAQKERIIRLLQGQGHVVGFLGDGINDSPALKAADVGISVENAVDIAKETADIILLEKSLLVLHDGVVEGRKVFGNISKYIRMGASSNFGNMFSVLGASLFLPFLPMAPLQVLTNNLLYDFSQTAIPTDRVDEEYLARPRRWDISSIFKFMIVMGPVSSIFDYATFGMMWFVFQAGTSPALFQTGWFVESLLTQTLVIHIIRTARLPFVESRASPALLATTLLVCMAGIALPYSWAAPALGLAALPWHYWPLVLLLIGGYAVLAQLVKLWFVRRWGM
ncbi:magnesium-translocating P-type ATPase [Massilia terrae]|uniref:Magnesium-transporting ATPase, P-type 1 n=1 Tax=Massilia terrae TaxID=1811224 RepID=A0ABT2D1J6_9BURK|nr:magnesium-translocating P-type ATPase [Massilia terrae]MCS0660116.1 magnesium-translocating P-type ATPase [Massilia terrae]